VAGRFPRRVAWGLDTRNGCVAVAGWGEVTRKTAVEVLGEAGGLPLAAIICTDIGRDGMMLGPNVAATEALVKASPWPVIASGGVTTVEEIRRLREIGVAGAIVGRALYEGKLTLEEALKAATD